ncbi:hypothetical protein PZA11_008040 [Diplocarpon coronariae]
MIIYQSDGCITHLNKVDNTKAIALAKNLYLYKRSKYIDITYHFIYNLIIKNKLLITYIPTNQIVADRFIKLLKIVAKFKAFKDILRLQKILNKILTLNTCLKSSSILGIG